MIFINITDGVDRQVLFASWPILVIAAGFYICMYGGGLAMTRLFHLQKDRVGIFQAIPVLLFLILGIFPVGEEIWMAMPLLVGMPTMTAVVMMANASGLDGDYALGGVFITTVCGIVTLPVVCWLFQYVI